MTRRVAAAAALVLLLASCQRSSADTATFCERFDGLAANDPFADLDVARPAEMESAFLALHDAAEAIAAAAPAQAEANADAYVERIETLMDLLAGTRYDPRRLDSLEYNAAVADYSEVSERLGRDAAVLCPAP